MDFGKNAFLPNPFQGIFQQLFLGCHLQLSLAKPKNNNEIQLPERTQGFNNAPGKRMHNREYEVHKLNRKAICTVLFIQMF